MMLMQERAKELVTSINPKQEDRHTLQKSMLLTPLLPSAGPTGGEGDACPAPTMSLTMTSIALRVFDMFVVVRRLAK